MFRTILLTIALTWIICFNVALTDDFRSIINEGELLQNDHHLKGIVPGILYPPRKSHDIPRKLQLLFKESEHYGIFAKLLENDVITKGLTFNIYDDNMRQAAVELFKLIKVSSNAGYDLIQMLDFSDVNDDLLDYVLDLSKLYINKHTEKTAFVPPFIRKPNFFINGEAIFRAIKLSIFHNFNKSNIEEDLVNQYSKIDDTIIINTNYSGWNLPHNGGEEYLNYFREDIALNSYYYGSHLMHPYWMSSQDLDEVHPRHNEHFYYIHRQLIARLLLEKEHLTQGNVSPNKPTFGDFNPYLIHNNGLPFPVRSNIVGDWSTDRANIKTIDIAIRECIARGFLVMEDSTTINMTEDNYVELLSKLIRANYDGLKTSKIVRSLFGYGGNGNPYDVYNPAPSLLHFPETALRDPIYWNMIQYVLNYFTEYSETMAPYKLSQYETENFAIIDANIPKITTYFDYYQIYINKAITHSQKIPSVITARQKRLKHSKFTFSFTVESKTTENVIVRLFIGPPCENCWENYSKFYELDIFDFYLERGINTIKWSPETSKRLSNDEYFNLERSASEKKPIDKYNMFKFPETLLIPRGLESGMNLTLFIIITPSDDKIDSNFTRPNHFYGELYNELDSKPLGFPFHRKSDGCKECSNNFKFYNVLVHHKQNKIADNGYFSPHLF